MALATDRTRVDTRKRAQKNVHRAFSRRSHSSSAFFFLDNIVTFYARERENSKDKTPTGDTHTKKKERENRNAHQKRRTPARYLSRNYFPWLKTCSFVRSTRLKRERNVAPTTKAVVFFMSASMLFPFQKEKKGAKREQ